jgi:geranylgeranyl diphosphate synthase type I
MFGAEDVTGKSAQDDVKEGKMTTLVHYVLKHGSHQQALELKQALGNPDLTNEQHDRVKQIVTETGSLKHARARAQEKANEAISFAHNSSWPDELKQFIEGLMLYVISRER